MVSTNRPDGGDNPRELLRRKQSAEVTKEFYRIWSFALSALLFISDDAHAAGDAQRGGDGREDADDQLDDELRGLFLHSRLVFCVD